jgi:hypothetical protein
MKRSIGLFVTTLGIGLIITTGMAIAERRPRRPPQEAFDACEGKAKNAECTVNFHGRTVTGKCRTAPDDQGPLACFPPMAPPPEAVEACANLSEGADCSVSFHGESVAGKCRQSPEGNGPLACVPPPPV